MKFISLSPLSLFVLVIGCSGPPPISSVPKRSRGGVDVRVINATDNPLKVMLNGQVLERDGTDLGHATNFRRVKAGQVELEAGKEGGPITRFKTELPSDRTVSLVLTGSASQPVLDVVHGEEKKSEGMPRARLVVGSGDGPLTVSLNQGSMQVPLGPTAPHTSSGYSSLSKGSYRASIFGGPVFNFKAEDGQAYTVLAWRTNKDWRLHVMRNVPPVHTLPASARPIKMSSAAS